MFWVLPLVALYMLRLHPTCIARWIHMADEGEEIPVFVRLLRQIVLSTEQP